jgi:hypothetical protein
MRIVGIRVGPVARVLAITYAVFGLAVYAMFAVKHSDSLTLPHWHAGPSRQSRFTLNLPRSSGVFYNIFLVFAAVFSFSASGWITGVAGGLCFNVVAKETGGIDAKYVSVALDETIPKPIL